MHQEINQVEQLIAILLISRSQLFGLVEFENVDQTQSLIVIGVSHFFERVSYFAIDPSWFQIIIIINIIQDAQYLFIGVTVIDYYEPQVTSISTANTHDNQKISFLYSIVLLPNISFRHKSDPNISHERDKMFSNIKSIIQKNETILSTRLESTPIMRKKNETSKTSCTCNIQ
ncbi:unnamed protein product (macronuclear) [Paramecium tetraurelia]|uniref:Uncharacterized protein n=1 Tax=Paramecium tetraurelia TaxID=5888 RepID=A0CC01_PARTE|nr:uncharacterized protein GSPATT00037102001 [Paramecium tetraurelia]CAK68318.1 unnamed protein product [Paramecium tetraurelia]|eukprot:XP_001435715.1 hypothetical protein (macronuclear) [Paramecium tetraurelia strain d4-2]